MSTPTRYETVTPQQLKKIHNEEKNEEAYDKRKDALDELLFDNIWGEDEEVSPIIDLRIRKPKSQTDDFSGCGKSGRWHSI